ncbi:MAG: hypothetical protein H6Q60_896 [Oscillospiraceae bacterium]|nr:hypothetical protein [Oscillospiraceae bacterium]
MTKYRRLVEWGKNLLILFLVLSAVYLLLRSHLYTSFSSDETDNWLSSIFGLSSSSVTDAVQTSAQPESLYPIRIVMNNSGAQFGLQYDQANVTSHYTVVASLFSEAATSLGTASAVSETDFRNALNSTGIYLEFPAPVSLSLLTAWLSGGYSASSDDVHTASQLVLALDSTSQSVELLYRNTGDGLFYEAAVSGVSSNQLQSALSDYQSNGAAFAFQSDLYSKLAPYTLIGLTAPTVSVYSSSNPIEEETISALLTRLSFSNYYKYTVDSVVVVREDSDALRFSTDGQIVYVADSPSGRFGPCGTLWDTLTSVQSILDHSLLVWSGGAQVYLSSITTSDTSTILTFEYSLNGAYVQCTSAPYAAQFTVTDGSISTFTLYARTFTALDENTPVLPELQAMAAMGALSLDQYPLTLCYQESEKTFTAGWVAGY